MTRRFAFATVWLWVWSATFPGIASAGIIDTSGAILQIVPPSSVELGALESSSKIFAYTEMLGLTLDYELALDITSPGFYGEARNLTPGSIGAKTAIDIYFVHFDPVSGLVNLLGSITFDQDILGVIVLNDSLNATDRTLGFPQTAYPTGLNNRGLDFGGIYSDFITISENRRTISINWQATRRVDQIRIITAIPAPGALVLLGLAGLAGTTRRRRKQAA